MKKIFGILFVIGIFLVGSSILITYLCQDELGKKLIQTLGRHLNTDILIQNVELSLFKSFPDFSLILSDVQLEDTYDQKLLVVDHLSFKVNPWGLINGHIDIKSISLSDGSLNLKKEKSGKLNYDILKTRENTRVNSNNALNINLERAKLNNIQISYSDSKSKLSTSININKATFEGNFSSENFDLKSDANFLLNGISVNGNHFLSKKEINGNGIIKVDLAENAYHIERLTFEMDQTEFYIDGSIDNEKDYTNYDLLLTSDNANLSSLLDWMPSYYLEDLQGFESKGKFDFEMWMKGNMNEKTNPSLLVKFGLNDGQLKSRYIDTPLSNVTFKAEYSNGASKNAKNSIFKVDDFSGNFGSEKVTLDLLIKNFERPRLILNMNGVVPMEEVQTFLENYDISKPTGKIVLDRFEVNGKLSDMRHIHGMNQVKTQGVVKFVNISFLSNEEEIKVSNGELELVNNKIKLSNFEVLGWNSDLTVDGTLKNLIPYLMDYKNGKSNKNLQLNGSLKSEFLDIEKLVDAYYHQNNIAKAPVNQKSDLLTAKSGKVPLKRNMPIEGLISANIKSFSFDNIHGQDFVGEIEFEPTRIKVKGNTDAMEGHFSLDGFVEIRDLPKIVADVELSGVNIKQFFEQTNDLGQEIIQAKHLSGHINSKFRMETFFDVDFLHKPEKLHVIGMVSIENGQLKDFELIEGFSDYVKIEDLKNIRFTEIQNWFEIKDRTFFFPALFIQSNAANLYASGNYNFDNYVDYNIKVNAGQVLINMFKKHDSKLNPLPSKTQGFFNLYYKIQGPTNNIRYGINRRQVKSELATSEHHKREIKVQLIDIFGHSNMMHDLTNDFDLGEERRETIERIHGDGDVEYLEGF